MQTIQQQRAHYALQAVQSVSNNSQISVTRKAEYKRYAMALPVMIHTNGLGQAAAFYRAKSDEHCRLYALLSGWLTQTGQPYAEYDDLLSGITQADMNAYRLAQAEAQALMDWVKKFAAAYLSDEAGEAR